MTQNITAWENEYKISNWKGNYSLDMLDPAMNEGRILDAGCGSGKYSIPLKMRGFDVVSLDISFRALEMLRKSSKTRELEIDIMAANVFQLPFMDDSFDLVWCYGVLQHLLSKERNTAVREFERILKKEGVLFIEVFGKDDMRYGGTEVEPDTFSRNSGIIYHYFDRKEIEELLNGFSINIIESHTEKRFKGEQYLRHRISVTAKTKKI